MATISPRPRAEDQPPASSFLDNVLAGLTARPKSLSSKYLYDAEGSRLFEQICDLPEYYPTRTETALLAEIAPTLAAHIPRDAALVEFGSGASTKTRLLLDAAPQIGLYVPVDISASALDEAAAAIRADYPRLRVEPRVGDFTRPMQLPPAAAGRPLVGFFPGSTIGNFRPDAARDFLRDARTTLGRSPMFILGVDIAKSPDVLIPAYDDAQGVTAAFNLNLLTRMNRELGTAFDPAAFAHKAVWNAEESRIEMHLVSLREQVVEVAGHPIRFAEGETIHTENSYKYRRETVTRLATEAGWDVEEQWIGAPVPFGIFLLKSNR